MPSQVQRLCHHKFKDINKVGKFATYDKAL